jgi:low temperature requirement protein LtrA
MSRFQRNRDAGEAQRATTLELFYDLVFVFAITQVSHLLLDDLSWLGAGEALMALLVVCARRRRPGSRIARTSVRSMTQVV